MNAEIDDIKNSTVTTLNTIGKKIDDDSVAVFDPRIKFASKKEEADAAIVWSTKSIELAYQAIDEGLGLRVSPFLKNNPNIRKANLLYQYTEEEILEILKCKEDIVYFAEKYVMLKTENGLQHIKLRPYQKKLLKQMQDNRWNIVLQSRQSGKCNSFGTTLRVRQDQNTIMKFDIGVLYNYIKCKTNKLSFRDRVITVLWKLYKKLEKWKQK